MAIDFNRPSGAELSTITFRSYIVDNVKASVQMLHTSGSNIPDGAVRRGLVSGSVYKWQSYNENTTAWNDLQMRGYFDKIGIGTGSVNALVHAKGTDVAQAIFENSGTGASFAYWRKSNALNGLSVGLQADGSGLISLLENNELHFGTNSNIGLSMGVTGNVSIGASPSAFGFYVAKSIPSNYISRVYNTSSTGHGLHIVAGTTGTDSLVVSNYTNTAVLLKTTGNGYTSALSGLNIGASSWISGLSGDGDDLVIGNGTGNKGLTIYTSTTGVANILFADGTSGSDRYRGAITYSQNTNVLNLYNNFDDGPAISITSSLITLSNNIKVSNTATLGNLIVTGTATLLNGITNVANLVVSGEAALPESTKIAGGSLGQVLKNAGNDLAVWANEPYDIVISTQEEFDTVFSDDATLANVSIFLKKSSIDYLYLNNLVNFGSNLLIFSNGVDVRRGNATAKFKAMGSADAWIKNIYLGGWSFDGQGGVSHTFVDDVTETVWTTTKTYSTGGSFTITGNGGFLEHAYVKNSKFLCHVFNCKASLRGGAYGVGISDHVKSNHYENISYCESLYRGGGCSGCDDCTISNISYCSAEDGGGGCDSCYNSTISNISYCYSEDSGGGCIHCGEATISNIKYCHATAGGGGCSYCMDATISNISHCTTWTTGGGGLYYCTRSTISNVNNCESRSRGGGLYFCDEATITNVTKCISYSAGGGAYRCNNSTIINVCSCEAAIGSHYGNACYECMDSVFLGAFHNNTDYSTLYNCTGIAFITKGTEAYVVTAHGDLLF